MKNKTKEVVEKLQELENLWVLRTNALLDTLIGKYKKIQEKEVQISKNNNTPIINLLDTLILELQKYKL